MRRMSPTLRNWIGVIVGLVACMVVDGTLVDVGTSLIPPPPGVNPGDVESIKANIHRYEFKDFVTPFIAHAVGSFVGAWLAATISATFKRRRAMVVGCIHMAGGIYMCFLLPETPVLFMAADLLLAYLPIAWLTGRAVSPAPDSPQA